MTSQAKCLLELGSYTLAKTVADQVLQQCPTFTDALLVQGEAFYNCCEFEHALVIFYKGARLSSDTDGFNNGIKKCIKTLQNIVASPDIFAFQGITMFIKRVKKMVEEDSMFLDKYLAGKESFPALGFQGTANRWSSAASGHLAAKQGEKRTKNTKKEPSLKEDKKYLEYLSKIMDLEKGKGVAGKISIQANQALEFLNGRSSFWNQIEK